jgi:hypothetical protein
MAVAPKPAKDTGTGNARKEPAPGSAGELFAWIADLGAMIPPEELRKFPTDGSKNLDHYLYGHPNVE